MCIFAVVGGLIIFGVVSFAVVLMLQDIFKYYRFIDSIGWSD